AHRPASGGIGVGNDHADTLRNHLAATDWLAVDPPVPVVDVRSGGGRWRTAQRRAARIIATARAAGQGPTEAFLRTARSTRQPAAAGGGESRTRGRRARVECEARRGRARGPRAPRA